MAKAKLEWLRLERSIRLIHADGGSLWELNVWRIGGPEKWRFTAMRDGVYVAARSYFPTKTAAKKAAFEAAGLAVRKPAPAVRSFNVERVGRRMTAPRDPFPFREPRPMTFGLLRKRDPNAKASDTREFGRW